MEEELLRLQAATLRYYLHETDPANRLIRDKTDSTHFGIDLGPSILMIEY
jgi:hypothetical protein